MRLRVRLQGSDVHALLYNNYLYPFNHIRACTDIAKRFNQHGFATHFLSKCGLNDVQSQ